MHEELRSCNLKFWSLADSVGHLLPAPVV